MAMKRDEKIKILLSSVAMATNEEISSNESTVIVNMDDLLNICDQYTKGVLEKAYKEIDLASEYYESWSIGKFNYIVDVEKVELILDNILNEED